VTGQGRQTYNRTCSLGEFKRSLKTKTLIRIFLYSALAAWLGFGWLEATRAESTDSPALSEIVMFGLRSPMELDLSHYRPEGRRCVKTYLDAVSPKSSLWVEDVPLSPENAVIVRRRNLEEQMVVLLGEKVRKEAKTFASAVPLMSEWEGMSEGPLNEADLAGQWLTKYPDTPIASFLHLFMAHRLRAGYEAARAGHEKGLWPILARQYREVLDKARSSGNPLISCIAVELDVQSHVYLEGQGRP